MWFLCADRAQGMVLLEVLSPKQIEFYLFRASSCYRVVNLIHGAI